MIVKEMPKFEQLKNILLKEIKSGKYAVGDKIPSETQLAAKYELNRETVNKTVSALVASGILCRKRGCGTYVAEPEKKVKLRLGVVISPSQISGKQPVNMFNYVDVFAGISRGAGELNCELEIISKEKFHFYRQSILEFAGERKFDGIVSYGYNPPEDDEAICAELQKANIPYVIISGWDKGYKVNLITIDTEKGTSDIVKHLYSEGHRNIACLSRSTVVEKSVAPRTEGLEKALKKFGVLNDKLFILCDSHGIPEKNINMLLNSPLRPSAIITTMDLDAFSICRYLNEKGVNIPEDISLVSIDDIDSAALHSPALSTLKIPREKMGYESVALVGKMKASKCRKLERISLFPELKIRETTRKI